MNSKRMFYVMVAGLVVLILAVLGSAYAGNMLLERQAKTLGDLKLHSQVLSTEQISLAKAKKDIAKYESLNTIAQSIVPQDKDQTQAVREIVNIASQSGIKPSSITFPASTLGSATSTAPAASSSTATTTAPAANTKLTQLTPVKGIPGLYDLQITITQDPSSPVSYSKFIDFLSRLEQNRRTAQVSGIVLQPSPVDRNLLSFTLTLDEYIKP